MSKRVAKNRTDKANSHVDVRLTDTHVNMEFCHPDMDTAMDKYKMPDVYKSGTITDEQLVAFENAMEKHLQNDFLIPQIGSLSEKNIHAVLKHYIEPDEDYQEIKIGRSYADICRDGHVFEIQTGSFGKLKTKLTNFLKQYHVTVVYPIVVKKQIHWVDHETGEITSGRTSPLKPTAYSIFNQLVYIRELIALEESKNLSFKIVFIHASEYKLLDGFGKDKKNRSTKYTIVPTKLVGEMDIKSPQEFSRFLTDITGLDLVEQGITAKLVSKHSKIHINTVRCMLNVLVHLRFIQIVGKNSRSYLYRVVNIDK